MDVPPMIYMRIHSAGGQLILAGCDKDLLGRRLEAGELMFPVSENFYGGDLVNDETFLRMLEQVTSANIIGNHCVDLLIDHGIVDSDSVAMIGGFKHVQIYHVSQDR